MHQKDLGVIIDSKLQFHKHISKIKNHAMSLLGILYRFTDISDPSALSLYFSSFILPVLSYCSPIWSMSTPTHLSSLNRITNFFIRIVKSRVPSLRQASNTSILSALSLESLSVNRTKRDLSFLYSLLNSHVDCPTLISLLNYRVPNRSTRSTFLLHYNTPRLSLIKRSLLFRPPSLFNSIPPSVDPFSLSKGAFINLALQNARS